MAFSKNNSKLGKDIWSFSIPAGSTCPGKTDLCSNLCYAAKGFFVMPAVKKSLDENLTKSKSDEFVNWVTAEIVKNKIKILRVHVAGDMFSLDYANSWYQVMKSCPDTRFFLYSRSWRIPEIKPCLIKMSKLNNAKIWWSVDRETGKPPIVPSKIRLAYMQVSSDDVPDYPVSLVFRINNLRNIVTKKVNGAVVCPPENGVNKQLTCSKCGICWRNGPKILTLPKARA